jgi:transposase
MAKRRNAHSKKKAKPVHEMPILRHMVAGIDIGSKEHWVCAPPSPDGELNVMVFGTTTPQLQELVDWLLELGVESVAMESTSVYWIPLYELLESHGIEAVLVNARQLSNVPGRKTDMIDCQWLQLLHSCGLLRGSFRPSESICALRALRRQESNLVAERTRAVQWMQKALDQMNVQVHRAVTDITGKTGMAIIRAIVDGERDPLHLAALRDRRCRKSVKQIAECLSGTWREEHLFNLSAALRLYETLETEIAAYKKELLAKIELLQPEDRRMASLPPHPNKGKAREIAKRGETDTREALWRFAGVDLTRIDGINVTAAMTITTEVGLDLTNFDSEKKFASWLRLVPRTAISGGKPLKKRTNSMGANRISSALRMAALSLQRSKTALGAYFRRVSRYKGGRVAIFATARKLAILVYRMLRYGQDYTDVGDVAYEEMYKQRRLAALKQTAKTYGFNLVPAQEAA